MRIAFSFALAAALAAGSVSLADDAAPAAAPDPAKVVEALKSKDRGARLAAARDAKGLQDDKLVAPLAALLADDDMPLRMAAIAALGARTAADAQKKAATALAAHLPKVAEKVADEAELIATATALGELAQPSSVEPLLDGIRDDTSPDVVKARLTAVSNVPAPEAIEGLIQFLAKRGRGANNLQGHHCRAALKNATGEDRGNDPDAWRSWWKEAKKTFDFDAALRRRAAERQKQDDKEKRRQDRKDKKEGDGGGKKGGGEKQ